MEDDYNIIKTGDELSPEVVGKKPLGKKRGIGFTRPNKDQSKKARYQQKKSRRINRGK